MSSGGADGADEYSIQNRALVSYKLLTLQAASTVEIKCSISMAARQVSSLLMNFIVQVLSVYKVYKVEDRSGY